MLRDSGAEASAMVWLRIGVAGLAVCLATCAAAVPALADGKPKPNPEELWRAYPLEPQPTTTARTTTPAPTPPPEPASSPAPSVGNAPSGDPAWVPIAALAAGSVLLVAAAIALRRRRRTAVAAQPVAVLPPPDTPRAAMPAMPALPALPAPRAAPAAAAPIARAAKRAEPTAASANGRSAAAARAAAARRMPVCQVRWSSDGWFYAVTTGRDGLEQMVASSPPVGWRGPGPPEDTPETRWAIQQLARDLLEGDWRPLRTKGIDFDERRWYARRFRRPTEEEVEAGRTPLTIR
ncbi:MAG TPA: hypothetical protein VH834_23805 [Solirubrobacteraceae bacterium]